MKQFIKLHWKTFLFFAIAGIIGGFFTGIFVLDSYPAEMQQQLIEGLTACGLVEYPPDIIMGIFRCFLLNGGMGLMFGCLYRKYGLRYSMIAHGGCHIVSKLIWILFI